MLLLFGAAAATVFGRRKLAKRSEAANQDTDDQNMGDQDAA